MERLPIGLVAGDGHAPVGFIALRERAITQLPGHGPGLGALYVAPSHRSRGIGNRLVLRGMDLARALGHRTVYAVSARPGKIFTRAGWEDMGPMPHKGQSLALYRWQADEHSKADTD
jgi:predicted N-acetyltransferase YhbS